MELLLQGNTTIRTEASTTTTKEGRRTTVLESIYPIQSPEAGTAPNPITIVNLGCLFQRSRSSGVRTFTLVPKISNTRNTLLFSVLLTSLNGKKDLEIILTEPANGAETTPKMLWSLLRSRASTTRRKHFLPR